MANHDLSFAAVGGPLTAMVVSRDPPGITPMKVLPSPELRAALASQRGGIRRARSLLGTLGLGGSEEVLGFHPHIAERPHDTADLAGTDRGGHLGLQVAQGCLERPALGAQRACPLCRSAASLAFTSLRSALRLAIVCLPSW